MKNQLHHAGQRNAKEIIVDMPDRYHHGYSKLLHNSNKIPTEIDRQAFETDKQAARRLFAIKELIKFVKWQIEERAQTCNPYLPPKILFS